MTLILDNRHDFSLENFARVAWMGDTVALSDSAQQAMQHSRQNFMQLLDTRPDLHIYGVTSGYGQNASVRLDGEARAEHAARPPFQSMAGFGPDLPERIKRGIVFCRLTNFIEGHAAVTPALAGEVARMLDHPLPKVPASGNASAGEIIPLSHLFVPMTQGFELAEKETIALINGSPCASALMADVALATDRRLALVLDIFSMAIEALGAPIEAYDESLETLYGDPCISYVLQQIRSRIDMDHTERRSYQAPVSWRIVPQMLGQLVRTHRQLIDAATCALSAITDNPVVVANPNLPFDEATRVLSNGGFHNANACAAIDAVTGSFADIATLADRQVSKLFDGNVSRLPAQLKADINDGYLGCIGFVAADYAERARTAATRTGLIGSEGGGFGQNDILIPTFQAWEKCVRAGEALDACLAVLAVTCSQAFQVAPQSRCPKKLQHLLDETRFHEPPMVTFRAVGFSVGDLAAGFTRQVYMQSDSKNNTNNDSDGASKNGGT